MANRDATLSAVLAAPALAWLGQRLAEGGRRPVLALNGPVGAGKSHFSQGLVQQAQSQGLRLAVASIDDVYWPLAERQHRLAGNPFGVSRVPPGSHDLPVLLNALERWRQGTELVLPRFDKGLSAGEGDRAGWTHQDADALLLEGWLLGCRPLGAARLERVLAGQDSTLPAPAGLSAAELAWLPHWDQELAAYTPLWRACDGLLLLRPIDWALPRRWRFQAEARQRQAGRGWLAASDLRQLVRASLCSLPPALYQDPLHDHLAMPDHRVDHDLPVLASLVLDGRRRVVGFSEIIQESRPS